MSQDPEIFTMAETLRSKTSLSQLHLKSARLYARMAHEIEEAEAHLDWPQPNWEESKAHSITAVILSAAALEASINEFYLQVVDRDHTNLKPLEVEKLALHTELWPEVESFPALRKFQVALIAAGFKCIDAGSEPFQSAQALFQLRNALVHFKPEWDDDRKTHAKLEERLAHKFASNRLSAKSIGSMVWFPHKCFGAECANWAIDSARKFGNEFSSRMGLKDRFD